MERLQTQAEAILDATAGFDALLNNELESAHSILSAKETPFHLTGLGLTQFLSAALGLEQDDLYSALAVLIKAENACASAKRGKDEPRAVFEAGTEYKLLISTNLLLGSLVHILTESYLEFLKAVVKLNRSYKGFSQVFKIVFPAGVSANDSIATIITNLNTLVTAKANGSPSEPTIRSSFSSASLSSPSTLGSWLGYGKKRSASNASALKPSPSSPNLPILSSLSLKVPIHNSSVPVSRAESILESKDEKSVKGAEDEVVPAALWNDDPLTTLVISGAAFGFGLFGLIFSLLPPKLRKVIAWFGFSNSNRTVALKLLTVAATTSTDVYGSFAALSLLTYYGAILLMSGWQNNEAYLVEQVESVLERVETRFPDGTLWVLNRAKILRMKGDAPAAIEVIENALEKGSTFRQADSLLVFELSWLYLSEAAYVKAADSFLRMKELNSWSHSTYVLIAAGALLDLPYSNPEICARIDGLFELLPSLIGKKRLMGEPPATELFITRKLAYYHAKHARWIADGRLPPESKYWEVIRVTPAAELGHFWNTNGRASEKSLRYQIDRLSAFSPALLPPSQSTLKPNGLVTRNSSISVSKYTQDDLDSPEEVGSRNLLLGTLYRSLGELETAKSFLLQAVETQNLTIEEKWVSAFATFELAVLGCQVAEKLAEKALEVKQLWKVHLAGVDTLLDNIFAVQGEYNLRQRLESRAQMLRDEVASKRTALGI